MFLVLQGVSVATEKKQLIGRKGAIVEESHTNIAITPTAVSRRILALGMIIMECNKIIYLWGNYIQLLAKPSLFLNIIISN